MTTRDAGRDSFYTWVAVGTFLIVFAGFARTYYLKILFGSPALALLLHLHGLIFTLWFALFFIQARLIARHRVDLHRRLGVGRLLRQTLASSNPIESCLSTVERVARNVKRWRAGDHALRWTATGLLEAEKKFRKVKGFRELEILQRKLNPSLTQQKQVA